jgi:hypothetical protein
MAPDPEAIVILPALTVSLTVMEPVARPVDPFPKFSASVVKVV